MRQSSTEISGETEWLEAPSGSGMRLDMLLSAIPVFKSRSRAQKMIEQGFVRVGGKKELRASRMLRINDAVEYCLPPDAEIPDGDGVDLKLEVLFEDDDCLVINKPAGIAVHRGSGMSESDLTILDGLKKLFADRLLSFSPTETLVHRLDKETTGCLLIAKNPVSHQRLQKQFESRSVEKTYLACVSGVPSPAAAVIDAPIGRHTGDRTKMSVMQASATRQAKTTYHTLSSAYGVSLLACDLHTGRTHQIRVHMRSIGHPLLGDEKYQTKESLAASAKWEVDFLALHAWKLSFDSAKKKRISVKAELPKKFTTLFAALGIDVPKA